MTPDSEEILQLIAEATISKIDKDKPTFLFQSAGKDSNMIALALAKAGYQDKVTFISHKSKGDKDESEIAASIAKKLGFRHKILQEVDNLNTQHLDAIDEYFTNAPFPCLDSVTLAYPLYGAQMPELRGANIIDGMGNDKYMGHMPSKKEYRHQNLSKFLKYGRFLTKYARSESPLHIAGKTRSEWTGLSGLSFSDTSKIFKKAFDVAYTWKQMDNSSDYLDFRATIRGRMIDSEMFCRKVRNFADVINANMIFPYTNEKVATYFATMPENYLFDRKKFQNKLIFRAILKKELELDSDKLGKMAFVYDSQSIILQNWEIIIQEIYECAFWDNRGIKSVIERMRNSMDKKNWEAGAAGRLIYGIYLLSAWLNKNRWIERIK
jgi:asparagine synthase (glutamine-hydrolysing)